MRPKTLAEVAQSFHQRERTDSRVKPYGSLRSIDATQKLPGEGFKRLWAPLIRMDEAVRKKIDALFGKTR